MVTQLRLSNNSVERISTLAMHNLNCREQQTPMLLRCCCCNWGKRLSVSEIEIESMNAGSMHHWK